MSGAASVKRRRGVVWWVSMTALGLLAFLVVLLVLLRIMAALRETATIEMLAPARGRHVETGDGRIYVQDEGPRSGVPVVLIHGTAAWSEFWRGTTDHLTGAGFRVIALDLPPFGFSDRSPVGAYTRIDQARRINAVIEALGVERPILVGHSFGAGATIETVMRYPARTRGLVLVAAALGLPEASDPPPTPPARLLRFLSMPVLPEVLIAATATNEWATRWLLSTMLARKAAATPELADVLRFPMYREGTTADFVVWARYFVTPDIDAVSMSPERFSAIRTPTQIIWGDQDTVTPLVQGERLKSLIPGARLERMSGVGHIPQIEDPTVFRPLLVRLLKELSR